jgi:hypothetical protein
MNIIELITPYNIFLSQLPLAKSPGGSMSFSNISAIAWRPVLVVEEKPPTMGKLLVNFITCGCESSAPFL